MSTSWHTLSVAEALDSLGSIAKGLSSIEAANCRESAGPNEIAEADQRGPWMILSAQLREPMVLLLLAAAGVSIGIGEPTDAVVILVIVVLNAVLGFVQDYHAEQAMAKLKEMAAPEVDVRRDGKISRLPARDLVPGDVVLVKAGDRVPADCRVIETLSLQVQEAALTGESQPVTKSVDPLEDPDLPLGDRTGMIYMGSGIAAGRAEAVVAETGMSTELGKIAGMLQSAGDKRTPLQRRLARLGVRLAIAAIVIVLLVFGLGMLRGQDFTLMLMTALSMAVAAVPEGLPAVATISLALGARRMLKRNALIRRLPAVETLGSVTVICTDKTGTLTENRMKVTALRSGGAEVEPGTPLGDLILLTGELCNDAEPLDETAEPEIKGEPTEAALLEAASADGLIKHALEARLPRVGEAPFSSERKRMTTVHEFREPVEALKLIGSGKRLALMKGSAESVLSVCGSAINQAGEVEPLSEERRQATAAADEELALQGRRVLGFAYRWLDETEEAAESAEHDFVFIGLAGLSDPPRAEAAEAVERCRAAGIRPVMITGDHPGTARTIAQGVGIEVETPPVTGPELEAADEGELRRLTAGASVYARVSPEHKVRIVTALQDQGEIVAMTGDGVNDAPALKQADIGVAMGITGSDVSKDAAEMVLLDDNFATIVNSVEEGRTIYDNILKFLKYTLTSNTGEILVMLVAPLLGMPLPLIPLQILWINLVTDGLPGLALAIEPRERNTMNRPPRNPKEPVLTPNLIRHILVFGALMGAVSLAAGFAFWSGTGDTNYSASWGTIIFTVLTLSQMGNALAIRSSHDSLFRIGLLSNKPILAAVGLTLVLQLAVIYLPFFQAIFQTRALSATELLLCLGLSTIVFWAVELEKWIARHR